MTWQNSDWNQTTVVVTGGAGFLGRRVVDRLRSRGPAEEQIVVPRCATYDLRCWEAIQQLFADVQRCRRADQQRTLVIHLAGNVGGIGYNRAHPGDLFYDRSACGSWPP